MQPTTISTRPTAVHRFESYIEQIEMQRLSPALLSKEMTANESLGSSEEDVAKESGKEETYQIDGGDDQFVLKGWKKSAALNSGEIDQKYGAKGKVLQHYAEISVKNIRDGVTHGNPEKQRAAPSSSAAMQSPPTRPRRRLSTHDLSSSAGNTSNARVVNFHVSRTYKKTLEMITPTPINKLTVVYREHGDPVMPDDIPAPFAIGPRQFLGISIIRRGLQVMDIPPSEVISATEWRRVLVNGRIDTKKSAPVEEIAIAGIDKALVIKLYAGIPIVKSCDTLKNVIRSTGKYAHVVKYATHMEDVALTLASANSEYFVTNIYEVRNMALPPLEFRHDPLKMPLAVELAWRAVISAHPYWGADIERSRYIQDVGCMGLDDLNCLLRWHPRSFHINERLIGYRHRPEPDDEQEQSGETDWEEITPHPNGMEETKVVCSRMHCVAVGDVLK
jgi:hypothetical protein